uniref:Uncharacterized protein n=1 Tax=Eutreptiella gymnastica TaxID=73025 RepID=A0A7S1I5G3_9EUGL
MVITSHVSIPIPSLISFLIVRCRGDIPFRSWTVQSSEDWGRIRHVAPQQMWCAMVSCDPYPKLHPVNKAAFLAKEIKFPALATNYKLKQRQKSDVAFSAYSSLPSGLKGYECCLGSFAGAGLRPGVRVLTTG